MGRESQCACEWNNLRSNVKVLLEPPDLVLRGEIRRKIPIAEMRQIRVDGDHLRFTLDGESIALALGSALASKWAQALLKPPPTLASKLGITSQTIVRMIGPVDDDALRDAIAEAKEINERRGDLILARVNTPPNWQPHSRQLQNPWMRG